MLIRIINGTYGHRPKLANGKYSNYVIPVTRNDPPIDVDDDEAKRLIAKNVAVALNRTEGAPVALSDDYGSAAMGNSPSDSDGESATPDPGESDAESLEELSYTDLKKLAKELGIDTTKVRKKEALIDAIQAREAQISEAPVLSAEEVME